MIIITALLITFFTFASSIKVFAWQSFIFETQLGFFKSYGLTRIHMMLTGLTEMGSAALLAVSLILDLNILNVIGAFGIMAMSTGALYFHFKFDTFKDAIPALVTLLLSSSLIAINWEIMCQFLELIL